MFKNFPEHPKEYYKEQIMSLVNLPTLPIIATDLLRITEDDNMSVSQILPIIEKDPPLAMKVLKIANSSYFGFRDRIGSLQQAIVILGMHELSHIALSFSVVQLLSVKDEDDLDWGKFWEHSAAVGHVAQLLCEKLDVPLEGNPYSLGLLHDIGKLVLYRLDPPRYVAAVKYASEVHVTAKEAELAAFGISHEDAGLWITEKWKLPEMFRLIVGGHHGKIEACSDGKCNTIALVQLADLVCNFNNIIFGSDFVQSIPRDEPSWSILKNADPEFSDMDFERFVMGIQEEVSAISDMVTLLQS